MSLADELTPLSYEVAFWAVGLDNPDYPIDQLGHLSEDVQNKLRTLAILTLLAEGDSDLYGCNLIRSGLTRELYLRRCRDAGYSDFHQAISRSGGFFDAIAAGDFTLARRIVRLSPDDWMPDGEYEDDFCVARFLHLVVAGAAEAAQGMLVDRLEACVSPGTQPQFDLFRAIQRRDQGAWDDAFEACLQGYALHIARATERGQMMDPHVFAERQIYVNGLALLKVSEHLGFATGDAYRFCPILARQPMTVPRPESFP